MKRLKVAYFKVRMIQKHAIETAQPKSERVYGLTDKTNQGKSDRTVLTSVPEILALPELLV